MAVTKGDTVTVLVIEHRHGANVSAFTSKEAALNAAFAYVTEWWEQEIGEVTMPTDRDDAIEQYFDTAEYESADILTATVEA